MAEKLSWDEIKARYHEQWIQLLDYDWPDGTPWPKAGIVAIHDSDRKAFWRKAKAVEPRPTDTAVLFVGPPNPPISFPET